MSKLEILELVVIGIIALAIALYYIVKAIKNGWLEKITQTINEAIKYAELNIQGGSEKKKYVLGKVEEKCSELGIPYTLIYKLVNRVIDKVISNYNIIKK